MKKRTSFRGVAWGLLLGATAGFSQMPDSVFNATDTNFRPMWNKTNLDADFLPHASNWSVLFPGTDTATIRTNTSGWGGSGWTNLVWKYAATSSQPNFEVRFSFRMLNPSGNSGFNFRGRCLSGTIVSGCGGSPNWQVYGPQIDLGPEFNWDVWNSGASRYVGANGSSNPPNIINNTPSCRSGVVTSAWNDFGFKVLNDTAFTYKYVSGFGSAPTMCAKYFFTALNDKAATSQGVFALQYETLRENQFRNIEIKNLDAVAPAATRPAGRLSGSNSLQGKLQAVVFSVDEPVKFSLKVTDVRGNVVKSLTGTGPVANREVALEGRGVYVARLSSRHGTVTRKITAY